MVSIRLVTLDMVIGSTLVITRWCNRIGGLFPPFFIRAFFLIQTFEVIMNTYFAHEVININGGNVVLDENQARRRKRNVSDNGDGTFAVLRPIQFKKGEKFGSDIEVNRRLAEILSDGNGVPMADVQAAEDLEKTEQDTGGDDSVIEPTDDESNDVS